MGKIRVRYPLRRSRGVYIRSCILLLAVILFYHVATRNALGDGALKTPGSHALAQGEAGSGNIPTRSFFPLFFYPEEMDADLSNFKNFGKFDPRLVPALYLSSVNKELQVKGRITADFTLPFNWNMLTDTISRLQANPFYKEVVQLPNFNCKSLNEKVSQVPGMPCLDYDEANPLFDNNYGIDVDVYKNFITYFGHTELRKLFGDLHRLQGFETPSHAIFLGLVKGYSQVVGTGYKSLKIPVAPFKDARQNLRTGQINEAGLGLNVLSSQYIELARASKDLKSVLMEGISCKEQLDELNKLVSIPGSVPAELLLDGSQDVPFGQPLTLGESFFDMDVAHELSILPDDDPLKEWFTKLTDESFQEPRHFGEPHLDNRKAESGHFDWRFFNGFPRDKDLRFHHATIHRLARSWFTLCKDADVLSWANHGPLIGFYYSGYTMPFDNDLDVQMPVQELYRLSRAANNSVIFDMIHEVDIKDPDLKIDTAAGLGYRSYYLDVNPTFGLRTKYPAVTNLIDARFIDVVTGQYIDITALAAMNSHTKDPARQVLILDLMKEPDQARFAQLLEYEQFFNGVEPVEELRDAVRSDFKLKIQKKALGIFQTIKKRFTDEVVLGSKSQLFDNLVNCRNNHFYKLDELLPLIPIVYENIPTYVPSNWFETLITEYDPIVLHEKSRADYYYSHEMRMWIHISQCKPGLFEEDYRERCLKDSPEIALEYKRLQPYLEAEKELLDMILPFADPKRDVKDIKDSHAAKHFDPDRFKKLSRKFDFGLLKPEPWVLDNLL